MRPLRSVLYIPGANPRAMEKAAGLACDAIIFDLEDAVSPGEKAMAREAVAEALRTHDYGPRTKLVRVNGPDTEWGGEDLAAAGAMEVDATLLPKVNRKEDVAAARARLGADMPVWAMMETCQGVLNAAEIAAASGTDGLVIGTNDLAKELNCRVRPGRAELALSLQMCLLAARAAGIPCVDGVYNAFKDAEGLEAECEHGRDLGMDGKTLIHPAQLEVANRVFAPGDDELELARRQIDAYEAAVAQKRGVAVLDGRIVEILHVETARATLAKADAIRELRERTTA